MQGNWGEMILVKLLENTSLQKGVNYFEQESFDVDGQRKQLDVRIALPNNKNIIIDSKVSIVAYQSFVNESEGPTKDKFLKDHLNSIRAHIKNLSSKNYPDIPLETLDFTILFMPVESAYISAVQADSHLFNEAFSQHIVLASPSTLLAMLKTIDHVWQREKQNQNVLEIAKRAGNLHDKFAALLDDFTTLERNFSTTQNTLGHIKTKLKGQGNLINQVQTIRQMKTTKLILTAFCILAVLVVSADQYIDRFDKYTYNSTKDIPHYPVGLVLGTTRYLVDGGINPYFKYRMQAVAQLFKAKKIDYIIVSGDNSTLEYNEPVQMKLYLMKYHQVPANRIIKDHAGFSTLESIIRAHKVFGQNSFVIVSQTFQNERALFIARSKGISAVGYNAASPPTQFTIKTRFRELFARVKAILDVYVLNTKARFEGPPEVIPYEYKVEIPPLR
ncbi:unnamed protein product [Notodromas monacha]|uniref:DUF218 domain-containing protein n=1 Tax=Notodromas monacha TaxID=399045 RepID=A0A7R9C3B8_9CRUS|nr:unnamed protein product [Notodromas monacha]CAG0925712.1 unnamed protein product [Notodromas monacha]